MSDIADQSDGPIEAARQAAIAAAQAGPFARYKPSGFCIWCGDPVAQGRVHCRPIDNDCEEVHLRYINFQRSQ